MSKARPPLFGLQGANQGEALENIQDAIREYLAAIDDLVIGQDVPRSQGGRLAVPKIPGVNHLDAVRALEKAGFRIVRQGKHIVMSDGIRIVTIPRHNPVNAFTMGGIARDAGLNVEQFKKLL